MKVRNRWNLMRPSLAVLSWLTCAASATLSGNTAGAAEVARVEEDWQLVVNQPDVNLNGPQVTCVISPAGIDDAYCALDINYWTQSNYSAGGLQMHAWNPFSPIVTCNFPVSGVMQTANETVTWTQTMSLSDGVLTFEVVDGQSTTWGTFGGSDDECILVNTGFNNLNAYDPNVSLENSGVSFASNLVDSLTLMAVRYYSADGTLIQQITTPQVVHPQD